MMKNDEELTGLKQLNTSIQYLARSAVRKSCQADGCKPFWELDGDPRFLKWPSELFPIVDASRWWSPLAES